MVYPNKTRKKTIQVGLATLGATHTTDAKHDLGAMTMGGATTQRLPPALFIVSDGRHSKSISYNAENTNTRPQRTGRGAESDGLLSLACFPRVTSYAGAIRLTRPTTARCPVAATLPISSQLIK